MIAKWLRESNVAAILLVVLRVYVGWAWLKAGWGKATTEGGYSAAGFITRVAEAPVMKGEDMIYPTYTWFLNSIVIDMNMTGLFSFLVAYGEVLVGLGLILGGLTCWAAFFGMVMNFAFMFAGTISTNPWNVLCEMPILFAGYNAGKYGLDYFIYPYVTKLFKRNKGGSVSA